MAEMLLTYDDLLPSERKRICNGCGGKGGWFNPPDLRSREFCDRHDVAYFAGGTRRDRKIADRRLYADIKRDASGRRWWQQPVFRLQAWLYYRAVRLFGRRYFTERPAPLTVREFRAMQRESVPCLRCS